MKNKSNSPEETLETLRLRLEKEVANRKFWEDYLKEEINPIKWRIQHQPAPEASSNQKENPAKTDKSEARKAPPPPTVESLLENILKELGDLARMHDQINCRSALAHANETSTTLPYDVPIFNFLGGGSELVCFYATLAAHGGLESPPMGPNTTNLYRTDPNFWTVVRNACLAVDEYNFFVNQIQEAAGAGNHRGAIEVLENNLNPTIVSLLNLMTEAYLLPETSCGQAHFPPRIVLDCTEGREIGDYPELLSHKKRIDFLIAKYKEEISAKSNPPIPQPAAPGDTRSEITERILELERTYTRESSEVDSKGAMPTDKLIKSWEAMGAEIDMLKGQLAVLDGTLLPTKKDEEAPAPEPPSPKKPGPKGGPRKDTIRRRAEIQVLEKGGVRDLVACLQLTMKKIPLPSDRLQTIYSGDWRKWFQEDTPAFRKQWSKDLKAAKKK